MNEAELIAWLRELASRADNIPPARSGGRNLNYRDETASAEWISEAQSALMAVFPPGHAMMVNWRATFERDLIKTTHRPNAVAMDAFIGIARGALRLLEAGRLGSVLDGVRAETVSELLDQGQALAQQRHVVAAAVVAGGALETHLLHLCTRNGLVPPGEGSIGKYDGAIAQERNRGGIEVYSATDSKLVGAWGGIRNDAAHSPTTFAATADDVRRMIDGIRQFIARVP